MYLWPNNENANSCHQKWFYCFQSILQHDLYTFACARINSRSTLSTPIETPPKHGFLTLKQHLLTTKIVEHEFFLDVRE